MLSIKENELLTRVGPGTPMGNLMRQYWHPIAAAQELDASPFRTKEVRILGEDLVLYRDRSGQLGLIERWCSHRRVNLAYGVVEQDGLRCQYHGWKFDHTGTCVEQPFEETVHPDGRFKEKCGVAGYSTKEAGGLIFAYLGPQPAAEFPMWEPLAWDNVVRDICLTELPCNWLQCQENSLDPVHAEWLHGYFGNHYRQLEQRYEPETMAKMNMAVEQLRQFTHQKIGFDVFDHGVIKRRVVKGSTEEDDSWRVGHPIMFPNILLVGSQFSCTLQFRVPVDDTHTYHVSLYTFRAAPGTVAPKQESVPARIVPLFDEQGSWTNLEFTFNQDYMAWAQQGPIAERNREKLGESDKGIILFRRLIRDQIKALQEGKTPMNVFRDAKEASYVRLPLENVTFGVKHGKRPNYVPGEAGWSADQSLIEQTLATWDTTEFSREAEGIVLT
ncbi:MAG: aromatic ring-hydroxylating dioxygenase subunit alpha [Dehalococcoidia bacterium]|nr:aromatic ring-hydroxylating dioxygenase subunit alpha [Dehalococcoidia bacterium]